jgi:hypothetical protein
MRRQRVELYTMPDYRPRLGRHNEWGFDPRQQREATYTGMGHDINVHDQWAVESQGRVQDRTREHLGQTDKAISAYRRLLLAAIEAAAKGERPLMALDAASAARMRGPVAIDGIAEGEDWLAYAQTRDARRRDACPWHLKGAAE